MAFTSILFKKITLILALNIFNAASADIFDATPEQLDQIKEKGFIPVHEIKVNDWPEAYRTVMEGQGVNIQRSEKDQENWLDFKEGKTMEEIQKAILGERKWLDSPPKNVPDLVDENLVENTDWVQFSRASYPIRLPSELRHDILWLRAPMTTPKTFDSKSQDDLNPWSSPNTVDELIEFINAHDAFGSNVDPKNWNPTIQVGKNLSQGSYIGNVEMAEGVKQMLWSGRHITSLIKTKYPQDDFVWFRVNRELRSFHVPNEIHIILKPKTGPVGA